MDKAQAIVDDCMREMAKGLTADERQRLRAATELAVSKALASSKKAPTKKKKAED